MNIRMFPILVMAALVGCVPPKFVTDIPATSSPIREARYYRTQDAANLAAGAVVDEGLRLIIKGPIWHTGQRADSTGRITTFTWTSNNNAPLYRLGIVTVLGGIRRYTDKGYRESGWMFNLYGGSVAEIANFFKRLF